MNLFGDAGGFSDFKGSYLSQIIVGRYICTFVFSDAQSITEEHILIYTDKENKIEVIYKLKDEPIMFPFTKLLGKEVSDVKVSEDKKKLALIFATNETLEALTEICPYECGSVNLAGTTFIF